MKFFILIIIISLMLFYRFLIREIWGNRQGFTYCHIPLYLIEDVVDFWQNVLSDDDRLPIALLIFLAAIYLSAFLIIALSVSNH